MELPTGGLMRSHDGEDQDTVLGVEDRHSCTGWPWDLQPLFYL